MIELKKRWYVIQALSGKEAKVKVQLEEHVARAGAEELFDEILIPTEEVVEMRAGQKRKTTRKFFPGYVLVRMAMTEDSWHLVKSVPSVAGFIGGKSDQPAPISQKEVDRILEKIEKGESQPTPKTMYEVGEVVNVTEGPFADFSGVVEAVNYEKSRLSVAVMIFGRSTPVDLEFGQVAKA